MRVRLARSLLVVLLGASWLVVPASPLALPACAQEGPHAVLVVDRGKEGGPLAPLCVALRAESVSGERFLRLASAQYDLQVRFTQYGGQGTAVCEIANVGHEGNDCLQQGEEYWGYWRGDGSGDWVSSANAGVDRTVVEHGDVEGWSWARGPNKPPHTTFEEGCPDLVQDDPAATPSPTPTTTPTPSPTPSRTKSPPPPREPDPRRLDTAPELSEFEGSPSPAPTSSDPVLPESATTAASDDDGGFPLAGALALAATIAMAGVALLLVRKRAPAQESKD